MKLCAACKCATPISYINQQEAAAASSSSNSGSSVLEPPPPLDQHFSRTLRTLGRPIRIYCDNAQVVDNLTRLEFEHVASAAEADVVWVRGVGPVVVHVPFPCLALQHTHPHAYAHSCTTPPWRPPTAPSKAWGRRWC